MDLGEGGAKECKHTSGLEVRCLNFDFLCTVHLFTLGFAIKGSSILFYLFSPVGCLCRLCNPPSPCPHPKSLGNIAPLWGWGRKGLVPGQCHSIMRGQGWCPGKAMPSGMGKQSQGNASPSWGVADPHTILLHYGGAGAEPGQCYAMRDRQGGNPANVHVHGCISSPTWICTPCSSPQHPQLCPPVPPTACQCLPQHPHTPPASTPAPSSTTPTPKTPTPTPPSNTAASSSFISICPAMLLAQVEGSLGSSPRWSHCARAKPARGQWGRVR